VTLGGCEGAQMLCLRGLHADPIIRVRWRERARNGTLKLGSFGCPHNVSPHNINRAHILATTRYMLVLTALVW
jgi:hypothetical protein